MMQRHLLIFTFLVSFVLNAYSAIELRSTQMRTSDGLPNNSIRYIYQDRKNFRKLKQKGYINHNTFVGDLERECFYCTTYGNGSAMLPSAVIALKRKQYFSWLDSFSNTKENGKVRKY